MNLSKHNLKRLGFWFAPFVVLIMVVSGIPLVLNQTPVFAPFQHGQTVTNPSAAASPNSNLQPADCSYLNLIGCIPFPSGSDCSSAWGQFVQNNFGPGCASIELANEINAINAANALAESQNIIIGLGNSLNITNSGTANVNATFQELLSYYEARAEAIVPYFLNATTWNITTYDTIAIFSGLIPSLIGIEEAIARQQWQDWNATVNEWNAAWGPGGSWTGTQPAGFLNGIQGASFFNSTLAINDVTLGITRPFMTWTANDTPSATIQGQKVSYFNVAPGGSIFQADAFNSSFYRASHSNYTITDLMTGTSFYMPYVSNAAWINGSSPNITSQYHIGQFDLLKVVCNVNCTKADTNAGLTDFESTNAYRLNTADLSTAYGGGFDNSGSAQLVLYNTCNDPTALTGCANRRQPVPSDASVCITVVPSEYMSGSDACSTPPSYTGGTSTQLSSGPGSVVGGNRTLYAFAETAQSLVNNTMVMAYDYWITLRAITNDGSYAIPANCAIPTPSDAFPTATNFVNYNLSANNIEAVYLAYLNAVAREYGEVFTTSVGFCGDQNLGFSFNWTQSWTLLLNITASVYIAGPYGNSHVAVPLNLNGTRALNTTYNNTASWPAYDVSPTLLYPYEYQANIPIGKIYPIPVNNPMIGVLVNYPQNLYYGNGALYRPAWGIPTYVGLTGTGNYTYVSGNLSNVSSGASPQSGDAIEINSCFLNGINLAMTTGICPISVTYFNNFTIGLVHSTVPTYPVLPIPISQQAAALCGTGALNQWYDAWAGYIITGAASIFVYIGQAASSIPVVGGAFQTFFTDLGCLIGYIVLILIFVGLFILIAWLVRVYRG